MNLELRHLKVICAIAESGSVTKAASLLGLAQPALTAQLQRIERSLGGPLFERGPRGATPTALGELVLTRARVVLPAMKGLQDDAARLAGNAAASSRYRIGAFNGPILGGLMSRLATTHPDLQLSSHMSWSTDELTEMVTTARLDFCLIGVCGDSMPAAADGLTWQVIAVDPVHVLLPDGHAMARRAEIDLAELADSLWVSTPGDGCFGDCFAAACARAGFTPRTMYELDVGGCIDLVQEGHAIGLCQATFRRTQGLVAVPITGAPLRWRHLLGWHPGSSAAAFAGTILAYAIASHEDAAARSKGHTSVL